LTRETRHFGVSPRLSESFSVEGPQQQAHKEENGLIERAWYRQQSESGGPAKRLRDATVAGQEPDSLDRSEDEGACGSHAASLGGEWNDSGSCERHAWAGNQHEVRVECDPLVVRPRALRVLVPPRA